MRNIAFVWLRAAARVLALIVVAITASTSLAHAQDSPPPIDLFVDESIGVGDGEETVPGAVLTVAEAISVTDDPAFVPAAILTIAEAIVALDTPTLIPPASITVNETVDVSDTGGPVTSALFVSAGPDQTVSAGEVATLAALVITLNPEFATAEIDWGDGDTDGVAPTAAGAIAPTHIYPMVGQYEVTVSVVGPFGDTGIDTTIITVVNAPPEVDAGGPYIGNVGEAIILSAAGFDPAGEPITYAWDLNNDGLYDDAADQTTIFSATAPGSFIVAVEVTDAVGQVANDTETVEVLGAPAIIGTPGPPEISVSPMGSITAFEGETLYIEALVNGDEVAGFADLTFFLDGAILTSAGPSSGYQFPQFTYILSLPMPQIPTGQTSLSLSIYATVTDGISASAASETLSIRVLPAEEGGKNEDLGKLSTGKIVGTAVIGEILRFSSTEIWVAADFSAVRVHVDSNATKLSAELGAEAFATGNRVVVVADGPVAGGNATALKITPIPSKATREHKRVLVVKSDANDTAKVVGEDGEDLGQADAKDIGSQAGDQVVVIIKDNSGGRGGRPKQVKVVTTTDDVSKRLDEIAQKKFDDGELTDSADVDKLRDQNKAKDEERVGKIAEETTDDTAIQKAVDQAGNKIRANKAEEEADPLKTVRKETANNAAAVEHTIAQCATELLGRKITRKADVTPDEAARVQAKCIGDDRGPVDDVPPPEVIECAERVLGRTLDGPVSDAEKAIVAAECVGIGGEGGNRDEPPPDVLACIVEVLGSLPDRELTGDEHARVEAACASADGGGRGPGGAPPPEVIECIERVLGRPFTGDASEEERAKFEQECQGPPGGNGPGNEPPPNVLECIEDVLGRPLDGRVTPDERAKFDEVCGAPQDGGEGPGPGDGPPRGDAPPAEVTACAERVLGRQLDGSVTDAEKARITDECLGLGGGRDELPPPPDAVVCAERAIGHRIDGPISEDEKEIIRQACAPPEDQGGSPPSGGNDEASKQVAFCKANPNDPHCETFVRRGEGGDGRVPPISDELTKRCADNPSDPKCGGDNPPPGDGGGSSPVGGDELSKLCADNPADPKCGNDPPRSTDPAGDQLTKLCADNPRDPKCGGNDPPPDDDRDRNNPPTDDSGTKSQSPDDSAQKDPSDEVMR